MTEKTVSALRAQFTWRYVAFVCVFAAFLISICGCSTVIGTRDVGFRVAYKQINTNALLNDTFSTASKTVLHRYNIQEQFEKDPRGTLNSYLSKIANLKS